MSLKLRRHYPISSDPRIGPASGTGGNNQPNFQDALQNVLKLIPAEIVASYPVLKSLLISVPWGTWLGISIAAVIAIGLTALLRFVLIASDLRPQRMAAAVSTIACLLWIYAIGDYAFIVLPNGYQPLAAVAVVVLSIIGPYLVLNKVPR